MDAIPPEERAKHVTTFQQIQEEDGFITGEKALKLFEDSNLDEDTLAQIWTLSDVDQDGQLDVGEFVLSQFLISLALQGDPLPDALPDDLNPKVSKYLPPLRDESSTKYTELFHKFAGEGQTHMTPGKAHAILSKSKLPKLVLAQIWKLSDIDQDGKLSLDEFCLAMHLTSLAKTGLPMPEKLPKELLPGYVPSDEPEPEPEPTTTTSSDTNNRTTISEEPRTNNQPHMQPQMHLDQSAQPEPSETSAIVEEESHEEAPPIPDAPLPASADDNAPPRFARRVSIVGDDELPISQVFETYSADEYKRGDDSFDPAASSIEAVIEAKEESLAAQQQQFQAELEKLRQEEARRQALKQESFAQEKPQVISPVVAAAEAITVESVVDSAVADATAQTLDSLRTASFQEPEANSATMSSPFSPEPPRTPGSEKDEIKARRLAELELARQAIKQAEELNEDRERLDLIEKKRQEREQEREQRRSRRQASKGEESERRRSWLVEATTSLFPSVNPDALNDSGAQPNEEDHIARLAELAAQEEARIAEEKAKAQAEAEAAAAAKAQAEEEARIREAVALAYAQAKAEEEARIRAEIEARVRAEAEARIQAEIAARIRAEEEARAAALLAESLARQEDEERRRLEEERAYLEAEKRRLEEDRLRREEEENARIAAEARAQRDLKAAQEREKQLQEEREKAETQRAAIKKYREEYVTNQVALKSSVYARKSSVSVSDGSASQTESPAPESPAAVSSEGTAHNLKLEMERQEQLQREAEMKATFAHRRKGSVNESMVAAVTAKAVAERIRRQSSESSTSVADIAAEAKRKQEELAHQMRLEQEQRQRDWREQEEQWVPPSERIGQETSMEHRSIFKARLFQQGVAPVAVIEATAAPAPAPAPVTQPAPAAAPVAPGLVQSLKKAIAPNDGKMTKAQESAIRARLVAEAEERRKAEEAAEAQRLAEELEIARLEAEEEAARVAMEAERERQSVSDRLAKFGGSVRGNRVGSQSVVAPAAAPAQPSASITPFGRKFGGAAATTTTPASVAAAQPAPFVRSGSLHSPVKAAPVVVAAQGAVTQPAPVTQPQQASVGLKPATFVSKPEVITTASFLLPKGNISVPRATVSQARPAETVPAPITAPAPAPASAPAPVDNRSSSVTSRFPAAATVTQAHAPVAASGVRPATFVSQPESLSVASFLAPKGNIPVARAPVTRLQPEPVAPQPVVAAPIATSNNQPALQRSGTLNGAPASVAQGAAANKARNATDCQVCGRVVYHMDQIKVEGLIYHKACFRCKECGSTLSVGSYASSYGSVFCKPHFKQLFALRGNYDEGFGQTQRKNDFA